jgi:hypothetical protein
VLLLSVPYALKLRMPRQSGGCRHPPFVLAVIAISPATRNTIAIASIATAGIHRTSDHRWQHPRFSPLLTLTGTEVSGGQMATRKRPPLVFGCYS